MLSDISVLVSFGALFKRRGDKGTKYGRGADLRLGPIWEMVVRRTGVVWSEQLVVNSHCIERLFSVKNVLISSEIKGWEHFLFLHHLPSLLLLLLQPSSFPPLPPPTIFLFLPATFFSIWASQPLAFLFPYNSSFHHPALSLSLIPPSLSPPPPSLTLFLPH